MKLSEFKLKIPQESIALYPSENRDEARMLVLDAKTGKVEHRIFKDIVDSSHITIFFGSANIKSLTSSITSFDNE